MDTLTQTTPLVARVLVDTGLPHLDHAFDYAVPDALAAMVRPGIRVRVRFAGRRLDGYVVGVGDHSDAPRLSVLSGVVSDEVVLPPASVELIRAVADHYAGTFGDVARLAIPPRHATTEKAAASAPVGPGPVDTSPGPWTSYPDGDRFLRALDEGLPVRVAWQVVPAASAAGAWTVGLAAAAARCVAQGRSAVLVVPDATDLDELLAAVTAVVPAGLVVRQSADLGPAARYRAFLAGLRGTARVVVGTRAAVFAPVHDLGLLAVWDDGDDSHADPRAPYPHVREVAALRATQQQCALLYAGYARTAELQAWVERDWLVPIALPPARTRRLAAAVRVASDTDRAQDRDPAARGARLPHDAFAAIRQGLTAGPVLVQVPHAGYVGRLRCRDCGQAAVCACGGPLAVAAGSIPTCRWCGRLQTAWACPVCGCHELRAGVVGAARTAEELGRAFPAVTVVKAGEGRSPEVPDGPCLVVSTPGAEPSAPTGYAGAVLLDGAALLARDDLRAAEEALRRWLAVVALVRPGDEGGRVCLVAPAADRSVQALVRLDPAGAAARELAERRSAGYPPAVRMAQVDGHPLALFQAAATLADEGLEVLGPVEGPPAPDGEPRSRMLVRCPRSDGARLAATLRTIAAGRSARKDPLPLRFRVDPAQL